MFVPTCLGDCTGKCNVGKDVPHIDPLGKGFR